jgi:cobalamin biosynthesis Mg chelatase CobN
MAKKDDESQAATDAEKAKAPKVHKEEAAEQAATTTAAGAHTPPWPLITIGVVVTLIVLAIGGLWWLKFASLHTGSNRATR